MQRPAPLRLPALLLLLLPAVALAPLSGCAKREASAEDAIFYVQNARAGARVRALWPAGQAYINAVLAADSAYRRAIAPLQSAADMRSLPSAGDGSWARKDALAAEAESLRQALAPEAAEARAEALAALDAAIRALPAGMAQTDRERSEFIDAMWDALTIRGKDIRTAEQRLRPGADLRLALLEAAAAHGPASAEFAAAHASAAAVQAAQESNDEAWRAAQFARAQSEIEALRAQKAIIRERRDGDGASFADENFPALIRTVDDRIDFYKAIETRYAPPKDDAAATS